MKTTSARVGMQFWTTVHLTKDVAQCFDVTSENAMTAMGYDMGTLSLCLYHSSAVDMSVF